MKVNEITKNTTKKPILSNRLSVNFATWITWSSITQIVLFLVVADV